MLKAVSFYFAIFGPSAFALPVCTSNSQFKEIPRLTHKIAVVDNPDRKIDVAYAKAHHEPVEKVRKRFAPTGDFHCGSGTDDWGGQITVRGDIVTTSAHGFYNDDCTPRHPDLSECHFKLMVDGKEKSFEISNIEAHGFQCSRMPFHSKDDWAVVRLKESAPPSIKPYRIDKAQTANTVAGTKVVMVGKSSDFYYQSGGKIVFPKHYGDCEVKALMVGKERGTFATNCDSAELSSGYSVLSGDVDDPILLGIFRGGTETHEQLEQAWKNRKPNVGKFDAYAWSTYATPVSGELYDILEALKVSK